MRRVDPDFFFSILNQATVDIYGAELCQAYFGQVADDPKANLTVREGGPLEQWDYVIDEIVTPLEDVLPVEVQRLAGGQTLIQELHWKLVGSHWTFLSDCGDPPAG